MSASLNGAPKNKQAPVLTNKQEVLRTLAKFIYGVQNQIPELISSCYKPGLVANKAGSSDDLGRDSVSKEEIATFCKQCARTRNRPVIYMFKPKVEFSGSDAIVSCSLSWDASSTTTKQTSHFIAREKFRLAKVNGKYIICDARSTPIVFRYLNKREKLRTEYARLEISGGLQ